MKAKDKKDDESTPISKKKKSKSKDKAEDTEDKEDKEDTNILPEDTNKSVIALSDWFEFSFFFQSP